MSWNFRSTLEQLGELYYKYLKTCLKIYKPHFFVEYIEKISDNIDGNDEDDCCYNYYNQYRMRQIKVLDTEKNIKKMLIVFQTDCDREEKLITFKEIFTSLGRSDLVLDLYDSYFLDPESTFYVFEMECYDLTSDALLNKCIVPVHQLRKIVQKQLNCIFKLLRLDLQDNQADAPLYINLLNQNQIQVKLNLFDFYEQIQSLLDESYDGKKKQINEYDNEILQAANIDENLIIAINQQLSEYEQNTFLPQSKQKFLEKILSMNQKDQKEHCLKIFEMISQHPQYNNFQIIQIQKEYFELQLEKLNKTILLIGIKFDAANEALKMENEYKQLYLLSGKFKSYLIDTQTFQLENCIYLLLEFEKINDTEANQSIRLSDYTYEKDREAFDFLQMLIEISYELYLKYNIKLTDIDPYEILIQQNMQQGINQILIDRFNFKNCCKEYIKLISRCFERFNKYYDKLQKQYFNGNINYDNNHYHSILSYLQMVSNDTIKNINEIQKQYQNITKMLELLQTAIELKENNQYFYAYICQYNPYKLSVDLKNYFSTGIKNNDLN
ncbi:hypothetical protein TTHERM_00024100 (macronuclear) [Tetrahymena thermophila SB210]|uniref:Uncharacterized protein n=1 Tax=Tetrahymena thermophila (strain SB210) TaxID=312017 RepID=Q22R71_TETTS|nr:hypothetical protein TTHERM_00024100 [Tetrahymena thermophila SB210]EAR88251.2 hypothetical protein TTHERM_00024100 [Tetrahymena thermophila SB210]|eukprot:XP_001008496.2 hypothetical protein TTHERM_00024100 [Tetrahymena thermophila SB210]